MKSLIVAIAVAIGAGLVCWVLTAALGLLPLPWSALLGLVAAMVILAVALFLGRTTQKNHAKEGTTKVVKAVRGRRDVDISGVSVHSRNALGDIEVVKDISAKGNISIADIEAD